MPPEPAVTTPPPPLTTLDALFLDFDGTLVPIASSPEAVRPRADVVPLLRALDRALGGAVAIVTGRRLASVDGLLAPLRPPGAGLHGLELRRGADDPLPAPHPALDDVRARLAELARAHPGLRLEDKGLTLALHWRAAPHLADACVEAARAAAAAAPELDVVLGKAIAEIRPAGVDKGVGVRRLLERPPFAGRRPVFVGDDTTDEDAHRVVRELGGVTVKVGDGDTAAAWRLADPDALLDWLTHEVRRLEERP